VDARHKAGHDELRHRDRFHWLLFESDSQDEVRDIFTTSFAGATMAGSRRAICNPPRGFMSNYRRAFVPGGCRFFTVNLLERQQTLLVDHIATLREAVAATRHSHAFTIGAFVVLPDHLHAIWNLPPGDCDFSTRWRLIKNRFARALPKQERLSAVRVARNERGIWQRRFWEHPIRDEADYAPMSNIVI
jgi:REP element-mobilizing transposase RayT